MEIHIQLAGVELGPYSEKQVREYLEEGLLSLEDPAKFDGTDAWVTVDNVLSGVSPAKTSTPEPIASAPVAPPTTAAEPVAVEKPVAVAPQSPIASPPAPSAMRKVGAVTTSLIPIPKPLSKDTIRVPIPQLSKSVAAQQTTLIKKAIPVEQSPAAPPTNAATRASEKARTSLLTAVKILAKKSEPEVAGIPVEQSAVTPKSPTTPIALPKSAESTRTLPMSVVRAITKKSDLDEKPTTDTTSVKTVPVPLPKPTSSKPLESNRASFLAQSKPPAKFPEFLAKAPSAKETSAPTTPPPASPAPTTPNDAAFASAKLPQTLRTSPMTMVRALPKKKEPEIKPASQSIPAPPVPPPSTEKSKETAPLETVRFVPEESKPLPPGAVAKAPPVSPDATFANKSLKRTTGALPVLVKALAKKPGETVTLPPAPDVPAKPAPEVDVPAEVVPEGESAPAKPSFFRAFGEKIGLFKSGAPAVPETEEPPTKTPEPPVKTPEPELKKPELLPETSAKTEKLPKLPERKKPEYPEAKFEPDSPRPLMGLTTLPPAPDAEKDEDSEPEFKIKSEIAHLAKPKRVSPLVIFGVLLVIVAAALACGAYFFVQNAYQSADDLLKALKSGDQAQLQKLVDFAAVRQSLTDEVNAQMGKSDGQGGRPAIQAMINASIAYYITPEMISTLMGKPKDLPKTSPDQTMTPALASSILAKFNQLAVKSQKLVSYDHLVIDMDAAQLEMVYAGSSWKLNRIDLNTDFKLPEEPGAPTPSADLGDSMFVPVIETYLDDGKTKFEKKDWQGAIDDFTHVLDIDPKQTIAYSNRGMARSEKATSGEAAAEAKGDLDGAIADFTQAISLDPKLAEAYFNRGVAKSAQNELDGAVADFTQAITLDPKIGGAYYKRGTIRTMKGDYEGALADFTQAITLDPNSANAYSNRGYIRKAQHDLDGAIDDFTQALAINPKIVAAYYNRGLAKEAKADYDGAIADYSHALDIDPKMARAYYSRGNAKITKNDLDGAIADYNQALTLDPNLAPTLTDRALARQAKGDLKGALEDFNRALTIDPKIADAYYSRGLIKEQMGDLDGAIADSSRAIDFDPKRAQAYYNRGFAKLVKGNLEGAKNDLLSFCKFAPRDPYADHARLYLWLIAMAQNPNGTANQDLGDALQNSWSLAPDDFVTKIAQYLLDRTTEADLISAAASPDARKDAGQHCELWYFAGMKRLLAGDKPTAIDYFRKCLGTGQKDYCEYILAQAELQVLAPNP